MGGPAALPGPAAGSPRKAPAGVGGAEPAARRRRERGASRESRARKTLSRDFPSMGEKSSVREFKKFNFFFFFPEVGWGGRGDGKAEPPVRRERIFPFRLTAGAEGPDRASTCSAAGGSEGGSRGGWGGAVAAPAPPRPPASRAEPPAYRGSPARPVGEAGRRRGVGERGRVRQGGFAAIFDPS